METKSLSRDEVKAAMADRRAATEPLDVPEWGGTVYVRRLSADEAEAVGLFTPEAVPTTRKMVGMIGACLVDEAGLRLFEENEVREIGTSDFQLVMRLFTEVVKVNGLDADASAEAVAGFSAAQGDASFSS